MSYTVDDIKEAYHKLKSYIYYDNTDLLLRRQLVEFETNSGKQLFNIPSNYYSKGSDNAFSKHDYTLEEKFERLAKEINNYHENPEFINSILSHINIIFYPKNFEKKEREENFITNDRREKKYTVERATPFINAPIEIHIVSVLWILKYGVEIEKKLPPECIGNRLLLNKDKTAVVKGTGLFKPYFRQYQKWRDSAVETAESILKREKNVAFINLDIRDYFSSVRVSRDKIYNCRKYPKHPDLYNLSEIFWEVHKIYTIALIKNHRYPVNFYSELRKEDNEIVECVLPIGLVSSYILANDYLTRFDERVNNHLKPAYYGRYVDDLVIVISDPLPGFKINEENPKLQLNIDEYAHLNPSKLEEFVLENLHPIIDLVESPAYLKEKFGVKKVFEIADCRLYCQSDKSLVYFFKHDSSHLVIDKLKDELDQISSEFRDFPEEEEPTRSLKKSAYHLLYDGSEGKIRTLKDYKENRYGLTVYLTNKIFSGLRHENNFTDDEANELIKFFSGENSIIYYRLWERIFTLLLVNNKQNHYITFLISCLNEIDKIVCSDSLSISNLLIIETLYEYLDCAHEISLSLNLNFLNESATVERKFKYEIDKTKKKLFSLLFSDFETTKSDSIWLKRFRKSNMVRHHYVIHPLLTFTKASKSGALKNLTSLYINFKDYQLDNDLLALSPRNVKFWECCMARSFENLSTQYKNKKRDLNGDLESRIFEAKEKDNYFDEAFSLYKMVNLGHLREKECLLVKNEIFKIKSLSHSDVLLQEISIKRSKNLSTFKVAFANTEGKESNIKASINGKPVIDTARYDQLANIVKKARLDKSDILLFPEFFIPINLLSTLVKNAERNDVLTITGLEHIVINKTAFNLVCTILPLKIKGINDAVVVFRLKNHYAHSEESLIRGVHLKIAKPYKHRYDLFNWKNLYFSTYYCFELANSFHRSLFKSKIDLLIGIEWNKDTNYFSNIVESCSRDLHCYVAQVNTSKYGDTRLTIPVETARKDLLRLKGGKNDAILIAEIALDAIREFQTKSYDETKEKKEFKPLPPSFNIEDVKKRIENKNML